MGCRMENSEMKGSAQIFTNLDSALNSHHKSNSNRLLLIALVSEQVGMHQQLGWNILKDHDIISTAKSEYDLVIVDQASIDLPKDGSVQEFGNILKANKQMLYFVVVADGGLYPFRQFTLQEEKQSIIDDLEVGIGP